MAIIQIETNLDVIKKQRALVKEALGKEGIYIRAKETLIDLLDRGSLTDEARSAVIAETISKMVGDITASSMSIGLQWAPYQLYQPTYLFVYLHIILFLLLQVLSFFD